MEPERKVVATIAPAQSEEREARASYESVWRESVETKARLAEALNEIRALSRAFDELETYVRRHVKRLDGIASRLTRGRGD